MIPNILDFTILLFIVACYFLSSLRGGVKQIFSFAVLIVSFVVAGMSYPGVAEVLPDKVFPEEFANATGLVVVFLLAFGIVSLVGRFFDGLFKRLHFGGVDRVISIIVGVLKGFTLGCISIAILMVSYPADSPILTQSVGTRYILPAAKVLTKLLPKEEQETFEDSEAELEGLWEAQEEEE